MPSKRLIMTGLPCLLLMLTGCQSMSSWQMPNLFARKPELQHPEEMHLAYGRYTEQSGDLSRARTSYEAVLKENPKSVDAILGLARLDLMAGKPEQAERKFREAMTAAPGNAEAIEATGQFYLSQERYDDAVEVLTHGVDLAPSNRRMRHRLAIALARQGNIPAAEPHFVQAVGDAEADYNIGLIQYERGDMVQAEQRFLSAVMKKPTLAPAQHWLDVVRQEQKSRGIVGNSLAMPQNTGLPGASPSVSGLPQTALAGANAAAAGTGVGPSAPSSYAPAPSRTTLPGSVPTPSAGGTSPLANAPQSGPFSAPQASGTQANGITTTAGLLPGSPYGLNATANQLANPNLTNGAASSTAGAGSALPSVTPRSPLDPSTMNAVQLEQLQNSMTPAEREQFLNQLRAGR